MLILLCNEEKMKTSECTRKYGFHPLKNISKDDIDYTNNNFVLHMYLYIFCIRHFLHML